MRFRLVLGLVLSMSLGDASQAQQIAVDGSTGTQVINGNTIIPTDRRSVSGNNLFHSFKEFNVPSSGVTFSTGFSGIDGRNINNIINRVSGDTPSTIFGKIQSSVDFPKANVYLLNPNGIIFGSNASLDIGGSFYATTATSIGFDSNRLFNSDPTIPSFPIGNPINVQFAVSQPAAILNQANLSVKQGENISLVGGSVVSTGNLQAERGSVDIAAVQGNSTVILRSPSFIVGLEIQPGTVARNWAGKITDLPKLASLLTGSSAKPEASQVVVNPDGSLQLVAAGSTTGLSTILLPTGKFDTSGRLSVQGGDAVVKAIATGDSQILANRNINLLVPNLQTSGSLSLRADNKITLRDSVSNGATVKIGGNLIFQADKSIDILALNDAQKPIEIGGILAFRSNGNVLADSYFKSAGDISVRNLSEAVGKFFSAIEFNIKPNGNIQFKAPEAQTTSIQKNIAIYRDILSVGSSAADVVKSNLANSTTAPTVTLTEPQTTTTNSSTSSTTSTSSTNTQSSTGTNTTSTNSTSSTQVTSVSNPTTSSTTTQISSTSNLIPKGLISVSGLALQASLSSLSNFQNSPYTRALGNTSLGNAADLLLKEGRILEAQQTLDLSIVKEIEGYLGKVAEYKAPSAEIAGLSDEQQELYKNYVQFQAQAVQQDQELTTLRQIPEEQRTIIQQERMGYLQKLQVVTTSEFEKFISRPEVTDLARKVSEASLRRLQSDLRNLDPTAVILYPLIRDDRLELILITSNSDPIRRTANVSRVELNREIQAFRTALETVYDPNADARVAGKKLYEWLIKPLERDLARANAKTILYAPYAQLRYVPLAALYDGDQWLIEKFRINNITAASLQDFSSKPQLERSILAGAVTKGTSFKIGDRSFNFAGLPYARKEVEALSEIIPNSLQLLDGDFSPASTLNELGHHSLIHLATHAAFISGKPEDSFILFGNGDRLTLADVRNWKMKNVDLLVLSACNTATGEVLGNGEEILGFGYLMQQGGARATIASLWSVDDGGTQALMDIFYTMLKKTGVTKAEALRQAQIALITGNYDALGAEGDQIKQKMQNRLPVTVTEYLNHPYYWAPFIMIGNGL